MDEFHEKCMAKLLDKGLCVTILYPDRDNAYIMNLIVNSYLNGERMEYTERTKDEWRRLNQLPVDFNIYKYRLC